MSPSRTVLHLAGALARLIALAGAIVVPLWASAQDRSADPRPSFTFSTGDAFDAATVPAYAEDHGRIYAYIDAHLDEHVAHLQRWIRQRSISPLGVGIAEMAELVRDDLLEMGFAEARLVPTDGNPGVWGYYDASAEKTLMVYMMYDVQPVNEEDWISPPFEARIIEHERGRVLMGRGASNQKGPQRAFLNALASIIEVTGTLPVNIMLTAEGEEEIGSTHYPQIVAAYEDRLKTTSGVLFPMNSKRPGGQVIMDLGVKGIVYWELEATGGDWGGPRHHEIHGSYRVLVDSPPIRLAKAIASMTADDGNTVVVPGFYEGILPPTPAQQRLINGMARVWDDASVQESLGVSRWAYGVTGRDAIVQYLYMPTLNVDGIWGGYIEAGTKTVLPHRATAKMDSRLPPGLDPDETLAKIRRHLDDQGFSDLMIRKYDSYPAAHTQVDDPFVQAAISVYNKRGHPVAVRPWLAGSAPFYVFTEELGIPLVFSSPGHGEGVHGPNEFMVIEPAAGSGLSGLAEVEKYYVDLVHAIAEQ